MVISINMPPIELVILGLGALVMVVVLPRLARAMRKRVEDAQASLATRGYAVESSSLKPVGQMTRLWAKLERPTALYLQVSNLDPVQNLAGQVGIADMRVGDRDFDASFVVRSSHPELARRVLDSDTRRFLLERGTLRFRTGSIDSLLGADYFPEQRESRDLRDLWMIEVTGKPAEVDENALFALGRRLADATAGAGAEITDQSGLRTGFFEGR